MNIQSFINGVLTGMVIGVLFAPGSGDETRRRIARGVDKLKRSVNKAYGDFKGELSKEVNSLVIEDEIIIEDNIQSART